MRALIYPAPDQAEVIEAERPAAGPGGGGAGGRGGGGGGWRPPGPGVARSAPGPRTGPRPDRRAKAAELGVPAVIDPAAGDLAEQAREATGGDLFDVVIESAGHP